jgi:hypothetical protein
MSAGGRLTAMTDGDSLFDLYQRDFVRVAIAVPAMRVADPALHRERRLLRARRSVAALRGARFRT